MTLNALAASPAAGAGEPAAVPLRPFAPLPGRLPSDRAGVLERKLRVLADAAKFDASCSSSGARRAPSGRGIGATDGTGICHSFAPDGRCISLLKVLLTNWCIYDCLYCINRESSNVERARFTVDEVVGLTLDFYRRNVVEGLFLSSGIIRTPDYTMEQLIEVARRLREDHGFGGYIHLKTVPDASDDLIVRAGRHADRLSINVELPTQPALDRLAPEKNLVDIRRSMSRIRVQLDEARAGESAAARTVRSMPRASARVPRPPRFAPAGQTTQMLVGADASDDAALLQASEALYREHRLKRVYFSAFSPIPDASARLPLHAAPLLREHRLYQADWLMRFYGFDRVELVGTAGMLPLAVDPKLAWAAAHPEVFPLVLDDAPREALLRVPGLGPRSVDKLLAARRGRRLRRDDLQRLGVPVRRVLPFVVLQDHRPDAGAVSALLQARRGAAGSTQGDLFGQGDAPVGEGAAGSAPTAAAAA